MSNTGASIWSLNRQCILHKIHPYMSLLYRQFLRPSGTTRRYSHIASHDWNLGPAWAQTVRQYKYASGFLLCIAKRTDTFWRVKLSLSEKLWLCFEKVLWKWGSSYAKFSLVTTQWPGYCSWTHSLTWQASTLLDTVWAEGYRHKATYIATYNTSTMASNTGMT